MEIHRKRLPRDSKVDIASDSQFGAFATETEIRTQLYNRRADPPVNIAERMIERLGLASTKSLLEIGCGSGAIPLSLVESHGHTGMIYASDVSEAFMGAQVHASEKGYKNVQYFTADARALPLADSSVDSAISNDMLYHVNRPELALQELQRVVVDGGPMALSFRGDYNLPNIFSIGSVVKRGLGFGPAQPPYPNFDAEDAPARLSQFFDLIPEKSWPETVGEPGAPNSVIRPIRLTMEDWPDCMRIIWSFVVADIQAELDGDFDPAIVTEVRKGVESTGFEIFRTEIEHSTDGYFQDVIQDSIIIATNRKPA